MNLNLGSNTALATAMTDAEKADFKAKCNGLKGDTCSLSERVRRYSKLRPAGFTSKMMADDLSMASSKTAISSTLSSFAGKGWAEIINHSPPKTYRVVGQGNGTRRARPQPQKDTAPLMDELTTMMREHAVFKEMVPNMIRTLTDLGYEVKFKG